jgi:LPPG:FO 2-phospho-L-lactate transferase
MAQALRSVLDPGSLTVVVNVGDNTERYGVHIAADPDTVLYTIAGVVGPHGWGRKDDTYEVMREMASLGVDTAMTLGDRDFALCAHRTGRLRDGEPLSSITQSMAEALGIDDLTLTVSTDDPLETHLQTSDGDWLDFQTYFIDRQHTDTITAVAYHGAAAAEPAPGVVVAIETADVVVIAPSNPPLSIWPILAIDGIQDAVEHHSNVVAVSPLFGGVPLKGPANHVMSSLGLPAGTEGILSAYDGLLRTLFIDDADHNDVRLGAHFGVEVVPADTRLSGSYGPAFASQLLGQVGP